MPGLWRRTGNRESSPCAAFLRRPGSLGLPAGHTPKPIRLGRKERRGHLDAGVDGFASASPAAVCQWARRRAGIKGAMSRCLIYPGGKSVKRAGSRQYPEMRLSELISTKRIERDIPTVINFSRASFVRIRETVSVVNPRKSATSARVIGNSIRWHVSTLFRSEPRLFFSRKFTIFSLAVILPRRNI
jgi:hypothetical protein